jgi:hypothetical protein
MNSVAALLIAILLQTYLACAYGISDSAASSSFDSLVASQCRARCLSLYPWKLTSNHTSVERKHRSMWHNFGGGKAIHKHKRVIHLKFCRFIRRYFR